jgi:hypothetical protein
MSLPVLTKEERELFDGLRLAEGKTGTSRTYLEIKLEQVKALCLQEDPFEAARLKWLWLAYGMEEGWLEKLKGSNWVSLKANETLGLRTNNLLCKFCLLDEVNCGDCGTCKLQPYTGTGCEFVWDFWLEQNDPLPMLEAVLQASIDKEFAEAEESCSLWKVIKKVGTFEELEEVWKPTPWLVRLKTEQVDEALNLHRQLTEALRELLGEEASMLNPQANWREVRVSVHGWVGFGFRTEGMMLEGKRIYEKMGGGDE